MNSKNTALNRDTKRVFRSTWLWRRERPSKLRQEEMLMGVALVLPAVLILGATVLYPLGYTFVISFFRRDLVRPDVTNFYFLGNYLQLLESSTFWPTLRNSIVLTIGSVFLTTVTGMAMALLLNSSFRGRAIIRGTFILPWAMPTFAAAFAWGWLLDVNYGLVNQVFARAGLNWLVQPWLGQSSTALLTTTLITVWKSNPWTIMVFLAGLQMVPDELRDAARVDGASPWQELWHVVVPTMRYVILIEIVLNTIWIFNWFDMVYLLTGGGPARSTAILPIDIYKIAFYSFDIGRSSALGVVMLAVLVGAFTFMFRLMTQEDEGL